MLHMSSPLRSSRSRQRGSSPDLGGTTHESPSEGRQSRIALPKGRYGTSYSRSKLSCSASLLSTLPKARTKWPSGYLELVDQESIVTSIFWSMSSGA